MLARATPDDALWLLTADGIPQRGDAGTLDARLDALDVSPHRLDLGAALTLARDVLAADPRPGETVLLSDLQASAVSPARAGSAGPGRPAGRARRRPTSGIAQVQTGAQPWSGDGGRVSVVLAGDSGLAVPLTARLAERPAAAGAGRTRAAAATLALPGVPSGWWTLTAELGPDELRADDRRIGVVRVAPVARVAWDSASRYVAAACEVLAANRRIARGDEVTFGRLGRGSSVVQPPDDPARAGRAQSRARGPRRGLELRAALDRSRRHRQRPGGRAGPGRAPVPAPAHRQRAHRGAGERRRRARGWCGAATSCCSAAGSIRRGPSCRSPAGFMPFMDLLLNRLARGEVILAQGAPGDAVPLPDLTTSVRQGEREWQVEGGGMFRPSDVGAYYLLAGADTAGRDQLQPRPAGIAARARVRRPDPAALGWRPGGAAGRERRAGLLRRRRMGDLRGPLLVAALLLGLGELLLASVWRRQR